MSHSTTTSKYLFYGSDIDFVLIEFRIKYGGLFRFSHPPPPESIDKKEPVILSLQFNHDGNPYQLINVSSCQHNRKRWCNINKQVSGIIYIMICDSFEEYLEGMVDFKMISTGEWFINTKTIVIVHEKLFLKNDFQKLLVGYCLEKKIIDNQNIIDTEHLISVFMKLVKTEIPEQTSEIHIVGSYGEIADSIMSFLIKIQCNHDYEHGNHLKSSTSLPSMSSDRKKPIIMEQIFQNPPGKDEREFKLEFEQKATSSGILSPMLRFLSNYISPRSYWGGKKSEPILSNDLSFTNGIIRNNRINQINSDTKLRSSSANCVDQMKESLLYK